ncbi:unnamed protein product, partial [marine sediment metagenome]
VNITIPSSCFNITKGVLQFTLNSGNGPSVNWYCKENDGGTLQVRSTGGTKVIFEESIFWNLTSNNNTYDYTFEDVTLGQSYQTGAGTGSVTDTTTTFDSWYCSLSVNDLYYTETFNTDSVVINNYPPSFDNFEANGFNISHYAINVTLIDEHGIANWL